MLNLVREEEEEETEVTLADGQSLDKKILAFKVLVYDSNAQNVVATIMKVG
jgi:hypothetical protein